MITLKTRKIFKKLQGIQNLKDEKLPPTIKLAGDKSRGHESNQHIARPY